MTKSYLHQMLLFCFALLAYNGLLAQCQTGVTISAANGAKVVYTCPGDGKEDIVQFANTSNGSTAFTYVITDSNNTILGIPPGDSQNFEGAGEGVCRVWGFTYTGTILANIGDNVFSTFFSSGACWAISNNYLAVVRSVADGGTVSMPSGATSRTVCASDGYDDTIVFTHQTTSNAAYRYVVTDDQNNILGLPGNSLNFEGVPPGICRVWGLSYTGAFLGQVGNNAATSMLSDGCFDLSDNFIEITRIDVVGGTVTDANGLSALNVCVGDGQDDVIQFTHTTSSAANYAYFITDANNYVLGVPPGNSQNFEGAGVGVCRVWGISYTGTLNIYPGDLATNKSLSTGCFDLSDNFIEVNRTDCGMMNCTANGGIIAPENAPVYNRVVVANRASSSISVVDADQGNILGTFAMPNGGEPMYVVHNARNNTVLVGDYKGKVVAFDGEDYSVSGSADAAAGVFHMWMSSDYRQLWVNNELDKSISVINPNTMQTIRTFDIPADLEMNGFKPHDVIVDPDNMSAYVSLLNDMQAINYVVKYDATTFTEIGRVEVGADPHVSLTANNDYLYVASQGADLLQIFNRKDLTAVSSIAIPNAHGLGMNAAGTYLYIGNISDGGTNATYTLDVSTNTLIGSPVDAPYPAPHNYSLGNGDSRLYVTHSGASSDKLTIYNTSNITPVLIGELTVGNNPFGLLAYSFTDNTKVICAGDGQSDAFDVNLQNASGNSAWVITDDNGQILALPPAPPFDLEGAGAGTCLIWHLSYGSNFSGASLGNNAFTDLQGCYDLSNPITVIRNSEDGGTVAMPSGATTRYTCPGDGVDDIIMFTTTSNAANYRYVITDDQNNILGLPPTNSQNFEGAGVGTCRVWGLAFDGHVMAQIGDNINSTSLADGCYALSANYITVVRERPEGGTVTTSDGATVAYTCPGDGVADVLTFASNGASNANFRYVITDDQNNILGIPPGNSQDFEGAPVGICRVWGLSYTGNIIAQPGDNAAMVALTDGCYDLSDNFITVNRDRVNGGMVSTPSGSTREYICSQDGIPDVIDFSHSNASNSKYQYVITDDQNIILALPGNSADFDDAPVGNCRVWGFAYTGDLTAQMGDHVYSTQFSTSCWAISSNYIEVVRDIPNGGMVRTTSGQTSVTVTVGDGFDDVLYFASTNTSNSRYQYVVTDDQNNILGLPTANSQNFEDAPAGICRVWGLAYTGSIIAQVGDNAAAVALTDDCYNLSANYIEVNRISNAPQNIASNKLENGFTAKGIDQLLVAPNPVIDRMSIRFTIIDQLEEPATFKVYNLAGQLVQALPYELQKGQHQVELDLSEMVDGLYFIQLESPSLLIREKFVKSGSM